MSRVMPNPRQHKRKYRASEHDKEYNRIMEERRRYEESFAPEAPKPKPVKRAGPVTITKGEVVRVHPSYEDYISSSGWANRRKDYYATHEYKCQACGSEQKIHLHHKTYVRIGRELDEDLVPLCESCHSEVHKIYAKGTRKLSEVTDQFVKKGWLKQKKAKAPKKKGVKANQRQRNKANRTKAVQVLPHDQNPVQKTSPDVRPKTKGSSDVTVTRKDGTQFTVSDAAIRNQRNQVTPEPDFVRRARSHRRSSS